MTNPPRAIGYVRCSTNAQAESGLGLDAQRAAITAACTRQGYVLGDVFTDAGVSGATALEQRPGLSAAVAALRRGDVLIVAKRDRLARDVVEAGLIERAVARKRARILSAAGEGTDTDSEDSGAVMQRQFSDVVAENWRRVIAEKTRAALRAKRARGERAGNVPFGFQLAADGVRLEPNALEQRIVAVIAELRAAGVTLRRIADTLNADGLRTRSGSPWRFQYVANLVGATAAA